MTTTAETGLCERLANEAYLAKSAAHALQLAMRGSSLQGQERETLLELAESTAARSACLSERLDEESKTGDAAFAASSPAPSFNATRPGRLSRGTKAPTIFQRRLSTPRARR
jgi:hypothetical protein